MKGIASYRYSGNPQPTTRTTNLPLVEDEDPDILIILISWGCCNGEKYIAVLGQDSW